MHIIRLIGGAVAISIVAGTLIYSLKSVPKAMDTAHRSQEAPLRDVAPASAAAPGKDASAAKEEEKKPLIADESPQAPVASAAAAEPPVGSATIHKCIENGKVTYTSAACPASATGVQTRIGAGNP